MSLGKGNIGADVLDNVYTEKEVVYAFSLC